MPDPDLTWGRSRPDPDLMWVETQPGLWRSVNGKYVIVRSVLPEDRPSPTVCYTLRKIDPAMAAAYPGRLGYFLAEEHSLRAAQKEAVRDAYCDAHRQDMDVPGSYPALTLSRFFWPISDGTRLGALAIVRDGSRIVARVVGMARQDDPFEPAVYAEADFRDAIFGSAPEHQGGRDGQR